MTSSISAGTLAVRAEGLVKVFGDNRAVDGVDLRVEAGTVYGVLGPNGAGKTTTISMLATLLRPDGGRAEIFGHDVEREAQIVRQLVGVTGQYASVDETLSATENLVLFSRLLGLSRADSRRKAARAARGVRPDRGCQAPAQEVLRRYAAAPRPGGIPHRPSAADLPRRAHHGFGSPHPRADVGHDPPPRRRRLDRPPHDPVPRRGRPARRPHRGDRHRQGGRRGNTPTSSRARSEHRACSCARPTPPTSTMSASRSSACWA